MKIKTKSEVTITMTGAEAQALCIWLYENGANKSSGIVYDTLRALQELPEESEE